MPLTAEVRDPRSHLSRFLRERFPDPRPIAADFYARLADASTIPPVPGLGPELGNDAATIGVAFDRRLRYYLSVSPDPGLRIDPTSPPGWAAFLASLGQTVQRIQPVRRRLDQASEDLLNRHCIVLARRDRLFPADAAAPSGAAFPRASPAPGAGALLALGDDRWLADLRTLSWAAYDALGELLTQPAVLGPRFAGSRDAGGAEADLILGDCLVEVKTTVNPCWRRAWLDQLLGYALLDYPDRYRIRSIGIYLARQATFLRWALDDVIATLSGRSGWVATSLGGLRRQLLETLRRDDRLKAVVARAAPLAPGWRGTGCGSVSDYADVPAVPVPGGTSATPSVPALGAGPTAGKVVGGDVETLAAGG